jgi:AraC family transcriptional activator of pobA
MDPRNDLNSANLVQRVKDYIEQNYANGISLAHVARALHYSPAHLTSVVRKKTGRPITAWIIERRISAARERLLTTDEKVAAVAEAVGFNDTTYFARQFARANGATPARWRRKINSVFM